MSDPADIKQRKVSVLWTLLKEQTRVKRILGITRAQKQTPRLILICYYITKVFYENMNYVFYTKSIII